MGRAEHLEFKRKIVNADEALYLVALYAIVGSILSVSSTYRSNSSSPVLIIRFFGLKSIILPFRSGHGRMPSCPGEGFLSPIGTYLVV